MSKKPDFSSLSFASFVNKHKKEARMSPTEPLMETNEQIGIHSFYTKANIKAIPYLNHVAGIAPFFRGPYPAMYKARPWTIRQYAGFSTAKESNAFYRKSVASGQKGLSIAFDLPTQRGYDSDHPKVANDVGKAGVAIDTIEDMKRLFDGIPLDKMSVSMTMNGAVLPIMAFYIVTAKEQSVSLDKLTGTIQNDILKEFLVRNTYIYPPNASMKIVADILEYTSNYLPNFNSISISGYHMQEAGATADLELAYTLATGLEYVRTGIKAGLSIDTFAPRLSFFWAIGMNYFMEIAKMRAGRLIWAKLLTRFNPKNERSFALRAHSQTSGYSLTEQDPFNNVVRTCIEAMAAVGGQTQSLHTNALDEAMALPNDFTSRLARNTQLYLQHETGLTNVVDPWGGSYYVEALTAELMRKAWKHLEEIESLGGMAKAIQTGIPKRRIEEAAVRKQAHIDSKKETVIGVSQYKVEREERMDHVDIDHTLVRNAQLTDLKSVRHNRNENEVIRTLHSITEAAKSGEGNLLELSIQAAEARATLGEISLAYEKVVGRYKPVTYTIKGVYKSDYEEKGEFNAIRARTDQFFKQYKRRPCIMLAKVGQDGHDRGARVVSTALMDMGFDVELGPLFQTPEEAAMLAIEKDVHIVGLSSLAGAHKMLLQQVVEKLKDEKREDILVIIGGVIPFKEYSLLRDYGALAIFGPGTNLVKAAHEIMNILDRKISLV